MLKKELHRKGLSSDTQPYVRTTHKGINPIHHIQIAPTHKRTHPLLTYRNTYRHRSKRVRKRNLQNLQKATQENRRFLRKAPISSRHRHTPHTQTEESSPDLDIYRVSLRGKISYKDIDRDLKGKTPVKAQ